MSRWTEERLKEHLRSRGMTPELYNAHYDPVEVCVTFPLYNGARHWVGYQTYKPLHSNKKNKNDPRDGRYYTYLSSGKNVELENGFLGSRPDVDGVFGMESVDSNTKTLYVVEGVFKAAKLHTLGYSAIAVLTSTPKRLKPWFRLLRATMDLVAIGDNDPAGQKLVNTVKRGFLSPVDLDEMNDRDVVEMLNTMV